MRIEEVIKWRRHALNIRAGAQIAVESSTELREISKKLSRMQISTEIQKKQYQQLLTLHYNFYSEC